MAEAWPIIAARYHLGKSSKLSEIVRFFKKNRQPFNRALDIGTGTGALALTYKPYALNWDYLEVDEKVASQATQLLKQKVYTTWNLVEGKHFDLITVVDTFFYFNQTEEIINKLEAILNPGGQLLITLTNGDNCLWINRLRNYLNLGQKTRGLAFEETKEDFLKRFHSSSWRSVYFNSFSYPFEEIILLILDWLDQKLDSRRGDKLGVDKLTNTKETKAGRLKLLRLTWPFLKLVSFLDYPLRSFTDSYRFIVVFAKK